MMLRRQALWGTAALAVVSVVAVTPQTASALDASYRAHAAGAGARVTFTVPSAPLDNQVADAGGPVAEALLDSIGESSAYASLPFPGFNAATAPSLVRGASGGGVPVPDYPFFVSSKSPANPQQEFGSGPYTIRAESDPDSSSATSTAGAGAGDAGALGLSQVKAAVDATASAITASALSDTTGVAVGPLRIGRVFSTATVTFGEDGNLMREADTLVEGVTVDGTGMTLTHDGLRLADSDGPPADLKSVNDALSQANITVELLPKNEVDTGIVAPALVVTQKDGSGGSIVYTIGAASAFVDASLLSEPGPDASNASPEEPQTGEDPQESRALAQRLTGTAPQRLTALRPPAGDSAAPSAAAPPVVHEVHAAGQEAAQGLDATDLRVERARLVFTTSSAGTLFAVLAAASLLAITIPGAIRLRSVRGNR